MDICRFCLEFILSLKSQGGKVMKKKVLGSLIATGLMAVSGNAVDVSAFGHLGTAYNFGITKLNSGDKPWYGGLTGRVGVDVGMGAVSLGLGFAAGMPYVVKPNGNFRHYIEHNQFVNASDVEWYNWMSDAYLRVDTGMFSIVGGRYDTTTFFKGKDRKAHSGVDWFNGQNEGVTFKLDTRYFAWWGLYSYETMGFGEKNPDRIGSDLMGFQQYGRSGNLVSTGFDINIKEVLYIDPFVTYNIDQKYLQTGGKVQADFGKGFFKSKTIVRGMYQYRNRVDTHTFLAWLDQEFVLGNLFKFGGGGYFVGKEDGIITTFGQNSRFYGKTFGGRYFDTEKNVVASNYFGANSAVWYVFAGLEYQYLNFDFLYSGGDYEEISAIAQVNVFKNQWAELGVGGGWVRSNHYDNAVTFVKLSF